MEELTKLNLHHKLESSKEIMNKAIVDFKPYKICAMVSGGDDSIAALEVALYLGYKIDYIIHGNTGTGFPATLKYVKKLAKLKGVPLIIADAKEKYKERIIKDGFYGNGLKAHHMSYNDLKYKPFRKAISQNIRHRKRNRPVLLINGARKSESARRARTCAIPYNVDGPNIWVNIVNEWDKADELEFLESLSVTRNPVAIEWKHSGECNCGTTAKRKQLFKIKEFCPKTYRMLTTLENLAKSLGHDCHLWGQKNKTRKKESLIQLEMEAQGQTNMFMCSGNCEQKSIIDEQKKQYNRSRPNKEV